MIQKLKAALDADDRAVSPVIGVILMVAITVILAAVIASLTLGLGDSAQTAPTAKFDFEQDGEGGSAIVTVSHASGANIDAERLALVVDGNEVNSGSGAFSDTVGAGTSVTISKAGTETGVDYDASSLSEDSTVQVVWTSEDGSTSSTLATYTVQ